MRYVITLAVLLLVWIPYKLSDLSKDSSFIQDFGVAFICFAIGGLIYRAIYGDKSKK